MRIGHGFDVHAFGGEGPIIIGGVRIPYEKGLLAHSDGDVALHALTEALLGAAALGDIGKLFPDSVVNMHCKGIDYSANGFSKIHHSLTASLWFLTPRNTDGQLSVCLALPVLVTLMMRT